ncbi:MAG: hypothetical protein DI498_11455 [Paracoccus denitrificans]|nr:MAG: hypothetical protein DI498_11455 [Paracoccus denitrificans]PZO83478.1 MAG: hypothetical protein DI633_11455 [Paracoccus denitrificans]
MTDHLDGTACRALWVSVLERQLQDAFGRHGLIGMAGDTAQRLADRWLRSGPDMLEVAALCGLDGHEVRRRYIAGLINLPTGHQRHVRNAA